LEAFDSMLGVTIAKIHKDFNVPIEQKGEKTPTDEKTSLEMTIPIKTPIVRESQVGRALKILWFAFGFKMTTFVNPRGRGGVGRREFLNKGMQFFGEGWIENPSTSFRGSQIKRLFGTHAVPST
jgi:hypothetical protein